MTKPSFVKHYVPVDGDIAGNTGFYFASMRKAAMKTLWEEVLQAVFRVQSGTRALHVHLGSWQAVDLKHKSVVKQSADVYIQVWTQGPQVQKGHNQSFFISLPFKRMVVLY